MSEAKILHHLRFSGRTWANPIKRTTVRREGYNGTFKWIQAPVHGEVLILGIKPALIGLIGAWISGGIEGNVPQQGLDVQPCLGNCRGIFRYSGLRQSLPTRSLEPTLAHYVVPAGMRDRAFCCFQEFQLAKNDQFWRHHEFRQSSEVAFENCLFLIRLHKSAAFRFPFWPALFAAV
jgi:hypothetical protein